MKDPTGSSEDVNGEISYGSSLYQADDFYSRAYFSYDVTCLTTLSYTHRFVSWGFAYDVKRVIHLKCWFSLCCGCVLECSTLNPLMCHLFKSGGFHSICHVVFGVVVS